MSQGRSDEFIDKYVEHLCDRLYARDSKTVQGFCPVEELIAQGEGDVGLEPFELTCTCSLSLLLT